MFNKLSEWTTPTVVHAYIVIYNIQLSRNYTITASAY